MIDLFIKSYRKDFKWLFYCLESIKKYAIGYNEIIIIIPEDDEKVFNKFNFQLPERSFVHKVKEYGNGYIFQQYVKMIANHYCSADMIMYVDSDCVFTKKTDISKVVIDNKPEILITKWDKVGDAICWKPVVQELFEREITHEYMRRHGLTYHRETLESLQMWFDLKFGGLESYIMSKTRFSEFNVLGAYAHIFESDRYNFVDTDNWTYVDPVVKQYWSYSGLTESEENELKEIIK